MLRRLHYPHLGITKTELRAKNVMFWPQMNSQIVDVIAKCETCAVNASSNKKEPLLPHEVPKLPWQKVGIDIFFHDNKKFLLVVDYFSKYVEMVMLQNMLSPYVVNCLKSVFSRHGVPKKVISGHDTSFTGQAFKDFSDSWEFTHVCTSPHYSQANGMVERAIQSVKKLIKKSMLEKTDLYLALLEYRNTPISCNIPSPAEILFSRKLNGILPCNEKLLRPSVHKNVRKNLILKQTSQKMYYDRNAKPLEPLQNNESVLLRHKNKWLKGKIVTNRDEPRSYIVKDDYTGTHYIRNRKHVRPFRKTNNCVNNYDFVPVDRNGCQVPISPKSQNQVISPEHPVRIPCTPEPVSTKHVHFPEKPNPMATDIPEPKPCSTTHTSAPYSTRYGRSVKPVKKLNL